MEDQERESRKRSAADWIGVIPEIGLQKTPLIQGLPQGTEVQNFSEGAIFYYDAILDFDLLEHIGTKGWEILVNPAKQEVLKDFLNTHRKSAELKKSLLELDKIIFPRSTDCVVIAVVGLFDRGKTFLLNLLAEAGLPVGMTVHTRGLSFKLSQEGMGKNFILLDTAGINAPVKSTLEL